MGWDDRWTDLKNRFHRVGSGRQDPEADGSTIRPDHEFSYTDDDDAGDGAVPSAPPGPGGLRGVTRSLDRWFAIEVHQLEREARESGAEWAQAGLPRADAPAVGELPPEQALRRRASQIFTQWVQKVTTRVQDAIESHVQRARESLNELAHSIEEVRRARTEGDRVEESIRALEAANRDRQSSFGFNRYWHLWLFVPAIVLLIVVDWVANVPVFQELLPQDADIGQAWQVLAAEAELRGAFSGLYRMGYRIALSPEVALLALGVIIFLVILAHIFGESVRRLVALSEEDVPEARRSVRQYRRQFWVPAAVGLVGGIAVVAFLFLARQEIASFAETRLTAVTEQVATLDEQIVAASTAGNVSEVARLSALRPALEEELLARQERRSYAERIRATNVPIAILNSVLFLTAALLGYLLARDRVTAADPQDPRMVDLTERRRELRESVERRRERIHEADRDARVAIAWAEFLAQSKPFEDWEGRRERLARVTSLFRSENARLRGVDPENIQAFRAETRFDVAVPEAHGRFRLPNDFGAVKERHVALLQEWQRLDVQPSTRPAVEPGAVRAPETGRQVDG